MSLRLAALGMSHETNTFARHPTDYAAFEQSGILRGEQIVHDYADSHATMAGLLDAGDCPDFEIVPLLFTFTGPIGTITRDAFDRIVGEMIQLLARSRPLGRRPDGPARRRRLRGLSRHAMAKSRRACARWSVRTCRSA